MTERRKYQKRCIYCNKNFFTTHKDSKFCSTSCASKSRFTPGINIWSNGFTNTNVYILGLIAADGCLSYDKHSKRDNINITLKDYNIIYKINKILTPDKKIYQSKGCFSINYKNQDAIEFLKNLGITYRKSLTLKLPDIPKEFFWDFIRGYFDGDGCIYSSFNKNKEYKFISITSGSRKILESVQKNLLEYKIKAQIYKDSRNNSFYLKIFKQNDVKSFGQYMYKNADLFLERKRERFDFFL